MDFKETERKKQIAQSLGFSPIEPDAQWEEKIAKLYRRAGTQTRYELRNVSRRVNQALDAFRVLQK